MQIDFCLYKMVSTSHVALLLPKKWPKQPQNYQQPSELRSPLTAHLPTFPWWIRSGGKPSTVVTAGALMKLFMISFISRASNDFKSKYSQPIYFFNIYSELKISFLTSICSSHVPLNLKMIKILIEFSKKLWLKRVRIKNRHLWKHRAAK